MTTLATLKQKWMRDPEFKKAHEASEPAWMIVNALIGARVRAKLTQAQVAERMGTKQSVVSRMESARQIPSMSSLLAYAKATGSRINLTLDEIPQPKMSRVQAAAKTARSARKNCR